MRAARPSVLAGSNGPPRPPTTSAGRPVSKIRLEVGLCTSRRFLLASTPIPLLS